MCKNKMLWWEQEDWLQDEMTGNYCNRDCGLEKKTLLLRLFFL